MIVRSLSHIFGLLLLGEIISAVFKLPIPGSIIGMILLTVLLHFKVIKAENVRRFSELLIDNMAFLFVPPGVGLMLHFETLQSQLFAILGSALLSTILVVIIVGQVHQKLEK